MPGETDLQTLLANLQPVLDPEPYVFVTLPRGATLPPGIVPLATFAESEGLSAVLPAAAWTALDGVPSARYARLTMMVASSLEAVGMTAAIAEALTAAGISANVIAAYHHDHIFVPWTRRLEALAAIENLGRRQAR